MGCVNEDLRICCGCVIAVMPKFAAYNLEWGC